ncbi:MAG TPA: chemotaxis protein CheW [Thermoanaerobaculia bacterium]|nr:chemotaxis protein CheW [Thermoanaerobaculia bacterium]
MLSRRDRGREGRQAPRPALLAFVIGGRTRALSVGLVAAVAEIGPVTRVPAADPANLGLIVHRGAVLPLVDLGRRLEGGAAAADGPEGAVGAVSAGPPAFCIITRSRQAIAFPVEAVLGLQALPANGGATASPWEILDPLIVDLARDQDPAH